MSSSRRRTVSGRKVLAITGIYLVALAVIRLIWIAGVAPPEYEGAHKGQLDLRGWDIAAERPIALDGEWTLYPEQLLMRPGDAAANGRNADGEGFVYATVPANWSAYLTDSGESAVGFGTYSLRILVDPEADRLYAVRLPAISASSEVFVNGRQIAASGATGENAANYSPRKVPYTAIFTADEGVIDLTVQVANFYDRFTGGIEQSLAFGTLESISRKVDFDIGGQYAVCLLLLLHAVYSLILFALGIRHRALLYFILVNLCAIVTVIVEDDKLLLHWLDVSWEWEIKLSHLSYLGASLLLLRYTNRLLPGCTHPRLVQWFTWICAAYAAFTLVASASLLQTVNMLNIALTLVPFIVVPVAMWRSVVRGEPDAIFLYLGAVGLMNNMLWSVGRIMGWYVNSYYPVDFAVAFVVLGIFWFRRYWSVSVQTTELADKLQRVDKLKDQFLVNTSHELRNPLHGIMTIAETMLVQEQDGRNKANLRLMISVGRRMTLLLNDLLDLSKLKENRVVLHPKQLHVQSIAAGVLDMCRFMASGKPLRLVNRIADDFPPIVADENRVIQILFNLVHNAIKFTDEGTIAIGAERRDGWACLRVSDTGPGIDEKTLRILFEPYEQGGDERSSSAGGLGLGLSISKRLVELHGGTMTVDTSPGGSTFVFTLPLSEADEPCREGEAARSETLHAALASLEETAAALAVRVGPLPDRPSILAVDDDAENLQILAGALSADEYAIVTVTSGREALTKLSERDWDLVIADAMMPNMSGYELCRTIRERYSSSELPILMLTARAFAEDVQAGFRAGANDYATKPVDYLELRARVRALTDLKRSVNERLRMEAAWLQAQIQPHFLFNTLTSIVALSDFDTDRMRHLLNAFSDYLRASYTYRNLEKVVPLENELRLVQAYLYIEKERFEERLVVEWDVDERLPIAIPPLTVQTLVENALRHGIMRRKQGGSIRISMKQVGNEAEIAIRDNGVGMSAERLQKILTQPRGPDSGIGLSNTNRRLLQQFGEGLRIVSAPGEGTTVSFTVPIGSPASRSRA